MNIVFEESGGDPLDPPDPAGGSRPPVARGQPPDPPLDVVVLCIVAGFTRHNACHRCRGDRASGTACGAQYNGLRTCGAHPAEPMPGAWLRLGA